MAATPKTTEVAPIIDLEALTPEQAWELWKPVSEEYVRRYEGGHPIPINKLAEQMGVPVEVGFLLPQDPEEEAERHEWVEAIVGDVGDALE